MKNRWTLHVEDFGSIRSADIEVAPLMLFVGQNNTGKSYLASLLWGILEEVSQIFPKDIPTSAAYKRCEELILAYFSKRNFDISRKTQIEQKFVDAVLIWFNELLDKKKNDLIQQIFSYKNLDIGCLSLNNLYRSKPLFIEWDDVLEMNIPIHDNAPDLVHIQYISDSMSDIRNFYWIIKLLTIKLLTDSYVYLHTGLPNNLFSRVGSDYFYLPASRTGFMLSYKSLAAELMNRWGLEKQEIQTTFTLPTIRFLQRLIKAEMSSESPFADIAESLEKQILKGKIIQNSQIQSFYYVPDSSQKIMPLHTTSSLVTELAPLIVYLKNKEDFGFGYLIFEEPESHLHLEAQRVLAKHLVKLVNRGLSVWITTHSDTMFQQFNNLLASNEKRIQKLKNLSYQDDEMIKPEDIKAYQFNIENGKTDVVALKLTDDGFPVPTFNHTIWNLTEESMALQEDSEDAD